MASCGALVTTFVPARCLRVMVFPRNRIAARGSRLRMQSGEINRGCSVHSMQCANEMAEGGGDLWSLSVQKLNEELTCAVCQDHFKEPKVLPCLHYYCKKCVADMIHRAGGKPFSCPECRRDVQTENDDPDG